MPRANHIAVYFSPNYDANYSWCPYCGNVHNGMCPRIQYIEYHQDGRIKSVHFYEHDRRRQP
jgi:hypothetical protein